jgi:hypothetical protein
MDGRMDNEVPKIRHVVRDFDDGRGPRPDRVRTDHVEVVVPSQYRHDPRLDWARNQATLWQKARQVESDKATRTRFQFDVLIPAILEADQRVSLPRAFAQGLSDRYQSAVDIRVESDRQGKKAETRAYLLVTTRELTPGGFGSRTRLAMVAEDPLVKRTENEETRRLWTRLLVSAGYEAGVRTQAVKHWRAHRESKQGAEQERGAAEERTGSRGRDGDLGR